MRMWASMLVALLLIVSLAGSAEAKGAGKGKGKNKAVPPDAGIMGTVVKVDGKNLIMKVDTGEERTLATDEATVVIIYGSTSKLADLKADQRVKITPTFGSPQKIEVGAIDKPAAAAKKGKKNKDIALPPDPGLAGAVVKVDGKTLVIKLDTGEERTLTTDDATVVVINGTTAALVDLKAAQRVKVTPSFGSPLRVEVGATETPPTPAKKAKGKKNKNK